MIKKILVANRGEIAIHIMRACREIGIPSVAVHSEADKDALFTKYANDAYLIGPAQAAQSYLNIDEMIQTAKDCGADAVHPGYGFLQRTPGLSVPVNRKGWSSFQINSRNVAVIQSRKRAQRAEGRSVWLSILPGVLLGDSQGYHKCRQDIGAEA